jgi:hypothetical protein
VQLKLCTFQPVIPYWISKPCRKQCFCILCLTSLLDRHVCITDGRDFKVSRYAGLQWWAFCSQSGTICLPRICLALLSVIEPGDGLKTWLFWNKFPKNRRNTMLDRQTVATKNWTTRTVLSGVALRYGYRTLYFRFFLCCLSRDLSE